MGRGLLQTRSCAQGGRFVGAFPGELGLFAAKVAIGGRLFVDGAQQVQHLDDALGAQVEVFVHQRWQSCSSEITPVPSV